ncbi:MAG: hypothetical protein KF769_05580 [Parvibaculum sp.]|nr:hypothetical protein [Parvibaculum sp.]
MLVQVRGALLAVAALVVMAPAIALAQHHHGPGPRPPTPPVQPPSAVQQQIIQQQMLKSAERTRAVEAEYLTEIELDNRIGDWNDFMNLNDEEIIAVFHQMGLIDGELANVTPEEMYGILFDGGRDRIEARDEYWYGPSLAPHDEYASTKGHQIAEAVAERHNQTVTDMVEAFRQSYADGCKTYSGCGTEAFDRAIEAAMGALNNGRQESQWTVTKLVYQSGNDNYKLGSWIGDSYTEFLFDFSNTESGKSITDYGLGNYYGGNAVDQEEARDFAQGLIAGDGVQIASLSSQASTGEEGGNSPTIGDTDTVTPAGATTGNAGASEPIVEGTEGDQQSEISQPPSDSAPDDLIADASLVETYSNEVASDGQEQGDAQPAETDNAATQNNGPGEAMPDSAPEEDLSEVRQVDTEGSNEIKKGSSDGETQEQFVPTPPTPMPQIAPIVYDIDNLPPDCAVGNNECRWAREKIIDNLLQRKVAELNDLTDRYKDKVDTGYRETLEMKQTLTELESIPDRIENEFWNTWWMSGFIDYGGDIIGGIKTSIVIGACMTSTALCATAAAIDTASGKAEVVGAGIGEFSAEMISGSGDLLAATGKGGTALLEKQVGNAIGSRTGDLAGSLLGSTAASGRLSELASEATGNFARLTKKVGEENAERLASQIYKDKAAEAIKRGGTAVGAFAGLAAQGVDAKFGGSSSIVGVMKTVIDDTTSDDAYLRLVSRREARQ